MANITCQLECEDWVRLEWLPTQFGQRFHQERLKLVSGGVFDFDAVSEDRTIAASISTSGATTASGKHAAGKLFKLRSDMLFLWLSGIPRQIIVLVEKDMYDLCMRERENGRVPTAIEFVLASIPGDLAERLQASRCRASQEVSPHLS